MVVLDNSTMRGRRSFPPSARLELLLGRVRRRLGRHRRGKPSVRSLDSKPKGTLHQPQGDDGSAERPLRVQLSSQRQDDRSLLRQCRDSRLPQAIGRHEVSGPVPQSEGDSPVGRIHGDHTTSPVYPGVSQHESRSSQSAQPGDRIGMDATPGGSPRSSLPVAGDHRPIRDLADSKAPSVLCSSVEQIPKIAEFLTFLFKTEKAAVSTIKGYRAMLSSVFKFCLPEISSSPILKDLVRSFEISAPRP